MSRRSVHRAQGRPATGPARPRGEDAAHGGWTLDEPGEDVPLGLARRADRLGRLQEVLDLGKVEVGIAVIDELIQILHRLPDTHPHPGETEVLLALGTDEVDRLVAVVELVEAAHRGARLGGVVAEGGGGDCGVISVDSGITTVPPLQPINQTS